MPTTIDVVTVIAAAPAVVFDLELDMDLHAASLPGEVARAGSGRPRLELGDEVRFAARHFGLMWRVTCRITALDRPHRFVDEQFRGPFRTMRHEHVFEALDTGCTRMSDRMRITAPGGAAGSVIARLILAPYLRRLLVRRAAHIRYVAEAGAHGG